MSPLCWTGNRLGAPENQGSPRRAHQLSLQRLLSLPHLPHVVPPQSTRSDGEGVHSFTV